MGLGDFWLQFNNGKKTRLSDIKGDIRRETVDKKYQKIFDFFDTEKEDGTKGSDGVLSKKELNSLFNSIQSAAKFNTENSIFDEKEAEEYVNTVKSPDGKTLNELGVKAAGLFEFLVQLGAEKTTSDKSAMKKPQKTNQEVKAGVIESLRADSDETLKIISNMNNGDISDIYDSVKTFLDMDTSKAKVMEAAVNQAQGAKYMEQAQGGTLTREEYIKANKKRLQDMMKARLYKKDKNGIDYLDKNRAELKMSRKEFEALMLATIERMTEDMNIESIKEKIRQLPMTTEKGDKFLMDSVKQNAIVLFGKAKSKGYSTLDSATKYIYDTTKIAKPNPDDEKLLSFEEVFFYEQGVNYSKEDCEKYLAVQMQLTKNLSSYNKYLEFRTGADSILKEKDAEKALNSVIKLFEQFYSDPAYPNLAYKNLKSVVKNNNLPINVTQDETGRISMSMVSGSEDLLRSYVSDILTAEGNIQQERLDKIFGGNAEEKLEEMQKEVEIAHEKAYGNDFSSALGKAMMEDNQTFIQRYTGNASMTGMGLTVVGGILCFTPAAALGAVMVTAGNTLAIGGMVSESVLGFEEALTRKNGAEDGEYEELTKTMLMNLGGFGFGGVAGKTGMKLFNKFVSKELESLPKLSEAFKDAMAKGNRAEALKIVCSQPEYRKQFAKGLVSKLFSDFSISYTGDLIMMGVLDTQDDWESLLQSNLIGILAGMGGDIKEAAHFGMKGDKYRALRQKEVEKKQPSLSEIDKVARNEDINQSNLSPHRFSDVKGKKAQAQVSNYLDYLLEMIPSNIQEAPIDAVKKYDDFILPDGTAISRNHAGDNGQVVYDEKTKTHIVQDVDNAVLFWIKDTNGQEHVLPCLTPENVAKARRLIGYLATQEAVPRDNIDVVQKQVLTSKKAQTEADVTYIKPNQEPLQSENYKKITYDEAVATINEKIQSNSNVSDLMPFLKVVQEKYPKDFRIDEYGNLSFYDGDSKTFYSLAFDGQGNIIKFSKKNYKSGYDYKKDEQFYIYDKSGKQKEVSRDDYHKTWSGIRTSELRNYIITNPDLLPKETRELLLQDENHYYTKEDIDELSSMLKTPDNIAIVNKLLDTRGNENRAIRAIGNALNLSQQKFGVRDIIKVLKSQDARAYVLDKIAQNKYAKKTELEPLLKGETFSALVEHNFVDEVNTSYRTKDITLDKVGDIIKEYQTNPQIREQINQQVPDGEAACINGKMYCRADNTLVPIQLEKATFDKLFPVEERYNIQQGKKGDCYFIAELGGYATTPNGRAALYSSFRQEGNDIIIKFPRFDNIEIKFENGDLNKLYPVSLYKRYGQWQVGSGSAHVKACDGIKMIEQAYSFVRNNHTDENVQIVANDKFLMNKQMQELDGSRMGGGAGEVPGLFGNYKCLTAYTSLGFILDGAKTVEEGLDVLAKELETNPNVFGSVSFSEDVPIDVNDGLLRNHQYRIVGYDKNKQIVKMVNPHDSSKYMEIPLELFKAAEPSFSVFKINPPEVKEVKAKAGDSNAVKNEVKASQETSQSKTLIDGKYSRPLTEYDKIGNKVFEISKDLDNPQKIAEIKSEIETLRKTDPEKAEELQIILEMFTNPTKAENVTDKQIDAVVNYLNNHYDNVETYLTKQADGIGISGENLGRFGHRIKGEWSTRDKVANYISDAVKKGKNKTLLDAYQDVRDKYACRTVFKKGDYTKHPEIIKILAEGNYSSEAYRKAVLRAAELQSQPAVDMLKEAMRKAVHEGKDLSMMRISNYSSENGVPVFSPAQLKELKLAGAQLGINVEFIKLAKEIDPNAKTEFVKDASTKKQPSGYTALQINFVTKSGEIIEWQYRGELVNEFAEAEHLPYDLRTGKHPWNQYPELETLYKPVAELLQEKNMPDYAYDQLNKYFTDYYAHLRKLELGFESKEPKLEEYENWTVRDENGVETKYLFRFDKRLNAENLKKLHFYGEGIKDGTITPERALEEYNAEVGYKEAKQDTNNPIHAAKPLTHDEMIKSFRELGLSDNDIERVNTEEPMLSSAIELIKTMKEYNPEEFGNIPSGLLVNIFNHPEKVFNNEDSPFMHYITRDNVKALLEVAEFEGSPLEDMNFWQDTDVSQLYRMVKHYFDVTGEKFPIENITRSNKEFRTNFPTNEQVDVALRMEKADLWSKYAMLSHSMDVKSPQKVNDQFVAAIKELKSQAKAQGIDLSIEYGLNDEGIELVNRLKEYNDKSPIDFKAISKVINNTYLHPKTVVFYIELQEKGINVPPKMLGNLLREIDSAFSSSADADSRKDMAQFFIEHQDIYNTAPECCNYAVRFADKNNIELTKTLLLDKEFPNNFAYRIQQSVSLRGNLPNYKATDEEAVLFIQNKAKFAQKLCLDKTLNCPKEFVVKLIENYYDGCEEIVINGIKTGLLDRHPRLMNYPADCWKNILKRNLTGREVDRISINLGYSPVLNYARAKDDNIVEKHARLRHDALDNKDLLKSGMEDISDWEVKNVTGMSEAIRTLDLIGLSNTEAAFPLMLEEFGEFLRETSELSETKLSDANKELLMERVNPANTQKAKILQNEITKLKKQINKAVGEENLSKIQDIQAQKSEVDASISDLKTQLDNARMAIPEYKEIADKMVNLNQKSKEYKEYEKQLAEIENQRPEIVSLKNSIKEQQKQSKALNGQAQSVYYNCENAAEVKELMKQLSPKQKELKDYLAQYTGIEPQEVVTKLRVLSALSEISTEEEMANFIRMIKPSSAENNAAWNEAVNKKIFQKLGVEYDETLSQKLDLINCKYISKMFISNEEFFENMRILVDVIKSNPELSVVEAIDRMPQNIETKRIFDELGFDYEKFTKADKNSFTSVKVKLSADEAKQASIHNLEEDLNDVLFKSLPQKVTEPIFKQLKDELGVEFVKSQKDNWEGDGFNAGTTEYYRLYKNGKPIAFEDMDKIITLIKREINKNDFWTRTQGDEELDNARKTMYTHLIKMRTQEVDNALNIKDGEVAEIEVRKTDMYDIKKALGLGNDAQCCTALGRNMNEWSAPTYIMNKCIGAIELSDKGSFVGNTMIYLASVDGKPALVLDNIELKTKYQNNDKIRDTFMEYAKKLCAEIGQSDLPIYAGPNRHKLNMDIYPKAKHTMEIIGNSGEQEIYADYDASPHSVGQGEKTEIDMYRIR